RNTVPKEDIELAKKASELKKEEIAAKLKEQWWLEEKAKATEALGGRNEMLKRPKLGLTFELRKKLRNKRRCAQSNFCLFNMHSSRLS
ncbi:hypothetical protein Tco_0733957, partial [Tanacetum coccineum]